MDSNGENSNRDTLVWQESSLSASTSSSSSSVCCKNKRSGSSSRSRSKRKIIFLLGHWVCHLQQCLKLLLERIQIFQPKGAVKKNLFFVPKVQENLRNVEEFCRIIVLSNRSVAAASKEEGETGFEEDCWNRFCEIVANYFRLRLYMSRVVFGLYLCCWSTLSSWWSGSTK